MADRETGGGAGTRWSVVVPTRARPGQLAGCLAALGTLRCDGGEPELIVVDDDPAGSAAAAIESSGAAHRVRLLAGGGRGPAAARNIGLARARGNWVAFTDDDCRPDARWLAGFDEALGGGAEAAAGLTRNGAPGACAEASQMIVDVLGAVERDEGGLRFAASNNLAFRREALLGLGGFDEGFPDAAGEDRELCDRWVRSDRRIASAPGAVVVHCHELDVGGFWRQHLRYGRGARAFHRVRSGGGVGSPAPGRSFGPALAREVRRGRPGSSRMELGALALLSQLATAAGYASALPLRRGAGRKR